jgi:hypothetical protein
MNMDIYMIWVQDVEGFVWLSEAWDEDSIDANEAGWDEAKQKARTESGADQIRVVKASIDLGKVIEAFDPPVAELAIISAGEDA